jgi:flagellar motor switch protein FliM
MADPNDPSGGGEVLSQSEVDSLLAQVAGPEGSVPVVKTTGVPETKDKDNCQPYDFRHPGFLSPGELRRLRLRHEEFIRALSARLSIYMRMEFSLQMSKLHTVPYKKFAEALPNPAHLSLFKVDPLRGIGILDIHPRLGLTIVDRLLGGPAQSAVATHEFSEIEMALLDQAVQLILGEWCSHWASVEELLPTLLGHENNGQFLQTALHDTVMLALVMDAKLGDCSEKIQLVLPCSTLEPLIRKLGQATEFVAEPARPLTPSLKWNRNFDEVPVSVTALWDDLVLSAREVANLKPGDILPLDPRSARRVKLRLADVPKFQGSLGTTGGKWAVAVTDVVKGTLSY